MAWYKFEQYEKPVHSIGNLFQKKCGCYRFSPLKFDPIRCLVAVYCHSLAHVNRASIFESPVLICCLVILSL